MKPIAKAALVIMVAALCSIAFAPAARAGCSGSSDSVPRVLMPTSTARTGYLPASFALRADDSEDASIVGLWQITFTSKDTPGIPDGTVIDAGYATWHADGTEIMNSGRPPITGSFCMGVWKQVGRSTFKLNHRALSWDTSGMNFVGPASYQGTGHCRSYRQWLQGDVHHRPVRYVRQRARPHHRRGHRPSNYGELKHRPARTSECRGTG